MAPQTRRTSFPRVAFNASDSEQSSSSDEEQQEYSDSEEEEEEEEKEVVENENGNEDKGFSVDAKKNKGKTPISLKLKILCKVCGKEGHRAGFVGATYVDCPMKPCFLCKMPGHTTMTCPHRVTTEFGVVPAPRRSSSKQLEYVFERQLHPRIPRIKLAYVIPDQVVCAVKKYHSRRVTCLEFHPTNNHILLSGDKKGQLGVWDFEKVYEKLVYGNIHSCILNNMRFSVANDALVYGASSDGTLSYTDIESGISSTIMNGNPDGWQGPNSWKMLYGLDINTEKGLVLAADNFGFLHLVDTRTNSNVGEPILIHKKGCKVTGLHCNPAHPALLLSCGNDHFARIWDIRKLKERSSLDSLAHKRVVNSAYFSPLSGTKILTTAQDNRLRIWDSVFGNLDSPSREIVHSHDFNRHLTPFRAEWDPKDPSESLVVVGRYISENYNEIALHPIDFIDVNTGQLVAEVMDPNITTISPVNKLHPRDDVLASGSSRSLFIWKPGEKSEFEEQKDERKIFICEQADKKRKGKSGYESDDDIFSSMGKNSKSRKSGTKSKSSTGKGKR